MVLSLMVVVMMLMMVVPVLKMLVVAVLRVGRVVGLALKGRRVIHLPISSAVTSIVGCSGVNVEFYTADSSALLALEMQMAIAQLQF